MDPVELPPDPAEPRADPPEVLLDAPDEPPAGDTPDNLAATGDFPILTGPALTLTADGLGPRDGGPPPVDSLRYAVPGYEILSELGRGGMGVVYLARQTGLDRPVALKMILSGEHAGVAERDRFRREAQAVAALQHSNIVQIYDVGEAQGRPYLAFEYVGGGTLAGYLDGQPWPARPAADLVEALARAVHFAHTRGIVHRDLKPANVLLGGAEPGGPKPDKSQDPLFRVPASALRVPKITDFGLAKRFEPESASDDPGRTAPLPQTRTGAVVGTPSYLAPEQAAGKNRLVGPHTDVYALGAILYELLTGRPPFRGETPLDTVLQVMGDDPVPPAHLNRKVPRDLQTICLKCLQKDPKKRYASAEALADDLRRFLNREPIRARPVGRWERAVKFMNRHPAATVLGAVSLLALMSLLAVSLSFNVELQAAAERVEKVAQTARDAEGRALAEKQTADDERAEADKQRVATEKARLDVEAQKREAERGVYALQLFKAAALGERDPQRALRLLDDRNRCPPELRDFTWRYVRGQVLVTEQVVGVHQGTSAVPPAARVVFSPDGALVATASGIDPHVRVYDVQNRRLLFVLAGDDGPANGVAFADARTVAAAFADRTVRLWELPDARPAHPAPLEPYATLTGHGAAVHAVVFHPEGRRLASASADGVVRLWDVPPPADKGPRPKPTAAGVLKEHTGIVWALSWAETGLFSAGADGRVLFWRLRPGGGRAEELLRLKRQALALAVTTDGELLAAAGDADPDEDEPVIHLFRPLTDRKAGTLRGHTGLAVFDLSFAADGKRLASAGRDGTVRVWDVSALQERAIFRPEKGPRPQDAAVRAMRGVSFGPDGLSVVSGGQDGAVRLWGFAGQKEEVVELDVRAPLAAAAMSADGRVLVAAERVLNRVKVWHLADPAAGIDPAPARVLRGLNHPARAVAANEDGSLVAAATADGVYTWRADGADDRPVRLADRPAVSVAAHGNDVVLATGEAELRWLDATTGRVRFSTARVLAKPSLVAFSPDGQKLISAGTLALQVWDATTGQLLFESPLAHTRKITAAAVVNGPTTGPSWDLATADEGGLVKVWEFRPKPPGADGQSPTPGQILQVKERPAPAGLNDAVQALAFTADGRTLATGGTDRAVRLRDPETGQERAALAGHTDTILLAAFRADRVLLTVGREGFARVWRAAK